MKKYIPLILRILFLIYLIFIINITFFGGRHAEYHIYEDFTYRKNLIIFKTINSYIKALKNRTIDPVIATKNILGNIIMFIPLPIFIFYVSNKNIKITLSITTALILSLSIETMQLITYRGSFDIDDIILNMIGAVIGEMIILIIKRRNQKI